jgi:hypothetical protein
MECKEMISGYIVDPSMQHFIGNVVWDEARLISRYHSMASDDLGDADGALIFYDFSSNHAHRSYQCMKGRHHDPYEQRHREQYAERLSESTPRGVVPWRRP